MAATTHRFSPQLLEVLEKNDRVLTAPALFLAILDQLGEEQTAVAPEFKAIKRAGDEVGDFFFVAR